MKIMPYNYATLYMFKHGLGELGALKSKMQNKVNFVNHAEWSAFCASEDYEITGRILKALTKRYEESFESCFNNVMPYVKSQLGDAVANGIQQNLGKGPYDQISPNAICY